MARRGEETIRAILPELFRFSYESVYMFVSFIEVVDLKAGRDDELAIIMHEMYPILIGKLADPFEARGDPDPQGKAMMLGLGVGE